jgi:hypothetical protein
MLSKGRSEKMANIRCDDGQEFDGLIVELFKRQLELERKLYVDFDISGDEHAELNLLQSMTDLIPNGRWAELSSRASAALLTERVG